MTATSLPKETRTSRRTAPSVRFLSPLRQSFVRRRDTAPFWPGRPTGVCTDRAEAGGTIQSLAGAVPAQATKQVSGRGRGRVPGSRQKQEPGACTDLASDRAEALARAPRLAFAPGLQAGAVGITAAFRQSGSLRGPPSDSCCGTNWAVCQPLVAGVRRASARVPEQEPGAAASTLPRLVLLGESGRAGTRA
jgi:hypothetical protein